MISGISRKKQVLNATKAAYEIYLDAPERDWITCKAFSVYGEDKFSVFDRNVSVQTRDIPGEMGVFVLLSKYFNGYDAQRMELALDCRTGEYENLNGEDASVNMDSSEEKLYQLLKEGIPAMRKIGTVYISQAIRQMRVMKMPWNPSWCVSFSRTSEPGSGCGGDGSGAAFDILSRYDRRKKYFRLKDGSFLDVSDGQLRELSVLKNGADQ